MDVRPSTGGSRACSSMPTTVPGVPRTYLGGNTDSVRMASMPTKSGSSPGIFAVAPMLASARISSKSGFARRGLRSLKLFAKTTPDLRLTTAQARAGQPCACRAFAQALFVLAILSAKSSSNPCAICSGGPDSMMLRSGKPWLKSWPKLLGRDRLT